jgi:hypothetical protein
MSCDPAEVIHIESELAQQPNGLAVGVVDTTTGIVRLFMYDETDRFTKANPGLLVMAGHEAAAAMAGIAAADARGFVLGRQGADWHIINLSHLNQADSQANTMQMAPQTLSAIVTALQVAGVQNPVVR